MKNIFLKNAILALALLGHTSLAAQNTVSGCKTVEGILGVGYSSFTITSTGNFINSGAVHFYGVTTLTNNGGMSEQAQSGCMADYRNPCTSTPGTGGANFFDNSVGTTTINGNNPVRMYAATIDRNIQLDNEWQILNAFAFTSGIVTTDRTDPTHFLHFRAGSSVSGNDAARHVNGYAAWSGMGPFTLPIGNGTKQMPAGVVGDCNSVFKAAYNGTSPPYHTTSLGSGLSAVSQVEYWNVDGASSTSITLHFDAASNLSANASNLSQVRIAGWNGSQWVNLGNTGTTGTLSGSGTVTSDPVIPDNYAAFTFGFFSCTDNTASVASSTPSLCVNTLMTAITHTTTGATGIGAATGLPSGVTASWASNTITITGSATAAGTFHYSIPLTGGCGTVSATGSITIVPSNTVAPNTVSSVSGMPTSCINTALSLLTHTTTGATGIGTPTGLPAGVTASWASNTITISGTPTASGMFTYSIPLTGGCGTVSATGTITVTPDNTAGTASSTPTLCINTALTNITHTTTGATGIGTPTGLPAGVTAAWAANTITISGTPTAAGTFNYDIPLTGGCGTVSATGTIVVSLSNTVSTASSAPTVCENTPLTAITHTTTGATGIGTPTGLPAGVTASWASNTITITGSATETGTFNYDIPLTGGCGTASATGTITIVASNTVAPNTVSAASGMPTLCVNTALTLFTHTTTGATGVGSPTGLPAGVTASWTSNTISISSTPSASGTFNYSVPLTGGCGTVFATGTIEVTQDNTVSAASSTPTLCINTAMTDITHTTTGAIGIGTPTGLPAGVTASWASNTITLSGTPTASGTFQYTIPLTGGCGTVSATGTITVRQDNTVGAASSMPTLCMNTALTNITHATTGATGIGTPTGLPAGVTASWAANTITISGTPTASGTFNYNIPLTGGCGTVFATGTITVTPDNTAGAASSTPTLCISTALTDITHTTTGATGIGTPTGLPAGVTASWASNTITISGTPTASGTFNYTIPLTGGCGAVSATGTITVTPANTAGVASSTPTLCINTALMAITHTTTGATGIGTPTGLPAGVTATWASNVITLSGTPSAFGTFTYSIPLTGGCGTVSATGTIEVAPDNTVGTASSAPTLCENTPLTDITHATTGATGIGTPSGLPSGVTASWEANTLTITGSATATGTFNYNIPLTGGCNTVSATGAITIVPSNTVAPNTVSSASSMPTLCVNTALTLLTHTTTGATGVGTGTGLPPGVTASWASNTITISGAPTVAGTFNYSIPLTGGCGTVSATGTIIVTPDNTAGTASSTPTLCVNTALTAITHTTTGATGIGTPTGLPAGVTASWVSNTITISGTPTASGTFNYTIPLTGGCGAVSATGTIEVTPENIADAASSTPTLCINTALSDITHATLGATGIGTPTGLPAGVTASWASDLITIRGTPTASGTFNYSIPLTGSCGAGFATGTIEVTPENVAAAASYAPILCINTALVDIIHLTTGATGIGTPTGLPDGVTASWASNTITISGTPTEAGTFSYDIPLTGSCNTASATGIMTVTPDGTVGAASSAPTLCVNTPLTPITYVTTGATGIGTPVGLPAGVTASWSSDTIRIAGTPAFPGTSFYSIPLAGDCGNATATSTITVTSANTAGEASSTPTLCVSTPLTTITHTTTGATGIGIATGLPAGVTASWASNTVSISGTPTATGTFDYSIPLTGGCGNAVATGRSGAALALEAEEAELRAGSRVLVPLRVGGAESWDGLQFTLGYDRRSLRLVAEESTFGELETVGLFPEEGLLTCSWGKPLQGGERLLLLRFEVLRDGRLSGMLDANGRLTAAEAYRGEETRPVELVFAAPQGEERPRALQNYPNPFAGATRIPFRIPSEGQVWLRVYDLTGRLVLERSGVFPRGSHAFDLRAEELGEGNAWFYQIGGADWMETKQMTRF